MRNLPSNAQGPGSSPRRSERLQRWLQAATAMDSQSSEVQHGASKEGRLLVTKRVEPPRTGGKKATRAARLGANAECSGVNANVSKKAWPLVKRTEAASSRKPRFDPDDAAGDQPRPVPLTKKNLALFDNRARRKGTKGTNSSSASNHLESSAESATTKTKSTTSSGFAIQAQKNGILNQVHSKPPKNLEDRCKRLARSRKTASPPMPVYERYSNTILKACNEATMVFEAFTAFPRDVGFNDGPPAPQPDFLEGLEIREYQPFPVDEQIGGAVLFRDDPFSVTLPHIAGEWNGRGRDMDEAKMLCQEPGSVVPGEPRSPGPCRGGHLHPDGTNINFFAHYAAVSEDGVLEYHQYPITSTNLTNSFEDFKRGRRQLRNLQDDAKRLSYALRDQLKDHWKTHRGPVSSVDQEHRGLGVVPEEPELDADDDGELAPLPMLIPENLRDVESAAHVASTYSHAGDGVVDELMPVPLPPESSREGPRMNPGDRRRAASSKLHPPPISNPTGTAKRRKSSSRTAAVEDG